MIELNLTDLKEMITSPDAESRRLSMQMGITGGFSFNNDDTEYFKTHHLTWGSVQMDARFIIENVTKDKPTLLSIFPINVEYLLKEYK